MRTGATAGVAVFALWGLIEPFVPLSRYSGLTFLPFLSFNILIVSYLAVSTAAYAVLGAASGALLGVVGGLVLLITEGIGRRDVRREETGLAGQDGASAPGDRGSVLGRVYTAVLLWGILAFATLYFLNRKLPGSYLSRRSLNVSALGLAGVTAAVGLCVLMVYLTGRNRTFRWALLQAGRRLRQALLVAACVALVAAGGLWARDFLGRPDPGRGAAGPNVILISIDALRADHLSCYGYERHTSPHIDKLAGEGALFRAAFCQAPSSTPSHATMFTGLYPTAHGAVRNGDLLAEDVETAAEIFHRAGYETGGFLTNPWLSRQFGFAQGFDVYVESGTLQKLEHLSFWQFAGNLFVAQTWGKLTDPDLSFSRMLKWLRAKDGKPFFIFLHLLDPHGPYEPPGHYLAEFLHPGADDVARTIAAYDGEIRAADEKIGRLAAALREEGIWERTLICLTADHGENMDEHGHPFAHGTLYESSLRVPLIMVYPARIEGGTCVPYPVESVDILPTLLALAGQTAPEGCEGYDLTSLMAAEGAILPSPAGAAGRPRTLTSEEAADRPIFARRSCLYAVRYQGWKLIWDSREDEKELYHLESDPGEERDLSGEEPETMENLLALLEGWKAEEESRARVPVSRIGDLDPEQVRRLKALGYLR